MRLFAPIKFKHFIAISINKPTALTAPEPVPEDHGWAVSMLPIHAASPVAPSELMPLNRREASRFTTTSLGLEKGNL